MVKFLYSFQNKWTVLKMNFNKFSIQQLKYKAKK